MEGLPIPDIFVSKGSVCHLNQMTTSGDRVQTDVGNKIFSDDELKIGSFIGEFQCIINNYFVVEI